MYHFRWGILFDVFHLDGYSREAFGFIFMPRRLLFLFYLYFPSFLWFLGSNIQDLFDYFLDLLPKLVQTNVIFKWSFGVIVNFL